MRVKISRTINLEELPDLVGEIAASCKKMLNQDAERVRITMHDVPKMTGTFEEIIENIDLVSAKLQDIINIAAGWHQAKNTDVRERDEEL